MSVEIRITAQDCPKYCRNSFSLYHPLILQLTMIIPYNCNQESHFHQSMSPGHFAARTGSPSCDPCAVGTSTDDKTGAAKCSPCPAGHFAGDAGSASCDSCPAGKLQHAIFIVYLLYFNCSIVQYIHPYLSLAR